MEILKTERLLLRTWETDDFESAYRLWGDPDVTKLIDARSPLSPEQVRRKLQEEIERQEKFQVQYWAAALKDSGEVIGCCGLRPYALEKKAYEIGFHLCRAHWGKGYAAEAARGTIAHAFGVLGVSKLFAGHNPKNSASARLLEKLGFRYVRDELYAATGLMHPSYELARPLV